MFPQEVDSKRNSEMNTVLGSLNGPAPSKASSVKSLQLAKNITSYNSLSKFSSSRGSTGMNRMLIYSN